MFLAIYIVGGSSALSNHLQRRLSALGLGFLRVGRSPNDDFYWDGTDELWIEKAAVKKEDKIIFFAAISSPSAIGTDFMSAYKFNVCSTRAVIAKLLGCQAQVLFASSDVVYGETLTTVDEGARPNPDSLYAITKYELERCFRNRKNFYVMRLSYVVSSDDPFISAVIASINENYQMTAFDSFIRTPIFIEDVLDYAVIFILAEKPLPNICNLCGPESMSRFDMAKSIAEVLSFQYVSSEAPIGFFRERPRKIETSSLYLEKTIERAPTPFSVMAKTIFGSGLSFE